MATETVNRENATVNESSAEKTFTQTELDQIISERLKREREKYTDCFGCKYDSMPVEWFCEGKIL